MLAKDIMTKEVVKVSPETKVEEVASLLIDNKISGIPVVDEHGKVIGVVTEKDLIIKASELKVPFYVTLFDSIIFLENPIRFNNDLKKYIASEVKDAMTKNVVVVEEDTPVTEVVTIMQKKKVNRIPVVKDGKLVGIITRNDVLKSIVNG
ncbi:MAG: CBS domain-containing protein [Syntrophomonadaceae bacterium]|nr:CBS domain-containing protein [Syntrophomonadaceae bacterium]